MPGYRITILVIKNWAKSPIICSFFDDQGGPRTEVETEYLLTGACILVYFVERFGLLFNISQEYIPE